MAEEALSDAAYFLGFDGGGTKTECVLADEQGHVLARAIAGPSNPLRTGHAKAWFSLGEAADVVLRHEKITSRNIRGVCAGIGGASRPGVAHRLKAFFQNSYSNAEIRVMTDLEIAFEAAFGTGEGIILLAGTGSAAFGRDVHGRSARAGGRGPWFSDEGSAFDIGRRAFSAITLADEHRGPETALSKRILSWLKFQDWETLYDQIIKNPDEVFPKTFPLVVQLAEKDDAVAREILSAAADSLAALVRCVIKELGWQNRNVPVARMGGMFGRSEFLNVEIESKLKAVIPGITLVPVGISPAEAAVRIAVRSLCAEGHAA